MVVLETGLSAAAVVIFLLLALGLLFLIFKVLLVFLPGAVIAFVVWYLTNDMTLTGVAFIAVTLLVILKR
jgi:hypothetical protein